MRVPSANPPCAARLFLRSDRGVTLIETLVSLSLFAISMVGISNFLVHQIRTASSNHLHSQAYALAEKDLEDARSRDYAEMTSGSSSQSIGGTTFTIARAVQADVPAANMKQITVGVSWNEPGGVKNVTLQTIYTAIKR